MTIKEFSQIDNTFNEASFLTKVNNIFIKCFTAIMKDRLDEVDHFIGDDVFTYGEEILAPIRASNASDTKDGRLRPPVVSSPRPRIR